jgi:hypothetical protein
MGDEPPDLAAEGVPVALATVVERAMAKDPADRYADAAELRQALEDVDLTGHAAFVSGPVVDTTVSLPISARPEPEPELSPAEAVPAVIPQGPATRSGSHLGLWLLLPVLLAAALVAFLINRQTPTRPASSTSTSPTTAAPTKATGAKRSPAVAAPAATAVDQTVNGYYGLINQHRLDDSYGWLSPSYQRRSPQGTYRGFWNTISRVDVLSVLPGDHQATVTLRFTRTNGSVSTERGTMRFVDGGSAPHLLIDDYRAG